MCFIYSILVTAHAIAARHGLRVAGDGAVDFYSITRAKDRLGFNNLAENTDLLRREIDVREHLENPRAIDRVCHGGFVRHLDGEPDLLCMFRVGNANLYRLFLLVVSQYESKRPCRFRHSGLDPESSGVLLDSGFRRNDEPIHCFQHDCLLETQTQSTLLEKTRKESTCLKRTRQEELF